MNEVNILYPVLAHIFLVFLLFILLGIRKAGAVKNKAVDLRQTALNNQAWTPNVIKVSNNIANQFETPVLFYILCIVVFLTHTVSVFSVSLAWAYVALRFAHAYIHTTSNFVPYRMRLFALSLVIILILLLQTVFQVATNTVAI